MAIRRPDPLRCDTLAAVKVDRSSGKANVLAHLRGAARYFAVSLAIALVGGCTGLKLQMIKAAQQRPSNVAVYFRVSDHKGNPIPDLTAAAFQIYEDDQLVSMESKQTIANPEVAAVHYTLLLVDMSASVSGSPTTVDALVQAVDTFADKLDKQKVALYAFDGSAELYPIVAFGDQAASVKAGAAQLSSFKPKDPSTNLNGGIVKALDELDTALGKATQPLKFGTLVVFTDGSDRANRVRAVDMEQVVREKPFDVFAIGLGSEIQEEELARIGKSGTAMAADRSAIVKAFGDISAKVDARTKSYYLLSYCSPSRAGRHEVRIQALIKSADGSERVGNLRSDFDATGFAPGCDPNTPPSFDVTRGDLLAPPPDKPKKEEKDEKPEKPRPSRPARPAAPAAQPAPAAASPSPPPPQLPPPPPPAPAAKPAQDFNP